MEILIGITPLIVFVLFSVIILIQNWITDMRFHSRRTQRELNRIRRSLGKVTCVKHTLPTGEVEVLGPGVMEEMADEVIKEARERCVGDIG